MDKDKVADYMTRNPVTIQESASLQEAWNLLRKTAFTHLPVVDKQNKICGMLSGTDLNNFQKMFLNDAVIIRRELTVQDVMTTHVISISMEVSVLDANDLLLSKGFHALPVTHNEEIIGIISETDILRYYSDKYKMQ